MTQSPAPPLRFRASVLRDSQTRVTVSQRHCEAGMARVENLHAPLSSWASYCYSFVPWSIIQVRVSGSLITAVLGRGPPRTQLYIRLGLSGAIVREPGPYTVGMGLKGSQRARSTASCPSGSIADGGQGRADGSRLRATWQVFTEAQAAHHSVFPDVFDTH
jgi:hypothetical protein